MFLELVKKNTLVLLRARASAIALIAVPLIAITIAAIAFEHARPYTLELGIYAKPNPLVSGFVEKLSQRFGLELFDREKACIDSAKRGWIHACIAFSPGFQLGKEGQNVIQFYLDPSRINIVWAVLSELGKSIGGKSIEVSKNLTSQLLSVLDIAERSVSKNAKVVILLTTQNIDLGKGISDVSKALAELNLAFSPIPAEELAKAKSKMFSWVESAVTVGRDAVHTAMSALGTAAELSPEQREALIEKIKKLEDARAGLQTLLDTAKADFAALDSLIAKLASQLASAKQMLDAAQATKQSSIEALSFALQKLDSALISIAQLQKEINAVTAAASTVEIRNPSLIAQPFELSIRPLVTAPSYLKYAFPVLIGLFIAYAAALLATALAVLERQNPAKLRLAVLPVGKAVQFLAVLFTAIVLCFAQFLLISAIAAAVMGKLILLPSLAGLGFLAVLVFSALGIAIGFAFSVEHSALLGSVAAVTIALMLSDIALPVEIMPKGLAALASANPLMLVVKGLSQLVVFGPSSSIIPKVLGLAAWAAGLLGLAYLAFLIAERKR